MGRAAADARDHALGPRRPVGLPGASRSQRRI